MPEHASGARRKLARLVGREGGRKRERKKRGRRKEEKEGKEGKYRLHKIKGPTLPVKGKNAGSKAK